MTDTTWSESLTGWTLITTTCSLGIISNRLRILVHQRIPIVSGLCETGKQLGELFQIIEDPQLKAGKGFDMVEVMMRKDDAVASLKKLVQLARQQNRAG